MERQDEKRKLGAFLKAAQGVIEHLPKVHHCPIHGPIRLQENLRRAVQAVDSFLQRTGGGVSMRLKTASFHVRATLAQSIAWKRAREAEGHASVGTWLAEAADRHLEAVKRSEKPLALAWRRGRFRVVLEGREAEVKGHVSPPFGIFHGIHAGTIPHGADELQSLVYLPARRIVATMRTAAQCKALASEPARLWVRWGE